MFANLFPWVSQYAPATAILGSSPTRFWPFSSAPQKGQPGYGIPYAVFQNVYGTPEQFLGEVSDIDNIGVQVDAYADTAVKSRAAAIAIRDALEPYGYVTAYNGEEKDADTGLYRVGFTFEVWQAH